MSEVVATYEYKDAMVLIRIPRALVVLPLSQWIAGIRRGKGYRRHEGLKPGGSSRMPAGGEIVQPGADLKAAKKRSQ